MGWLTNSRAEVILGHPKVFIKTPLGVAMAPSLSTVDARTKALIKITPQLEDSGLFHKSTGEMYAIRNLWGGPTLLRMDRMLVPAFGARAYGVHVNGIVMKAGATHLWIGMRSSDRIVEPDKLDNIVAGGQPASLSIMDNIIKEAYEEAGLEESLARSAKSASSISYCFETPNGLRNDTLFCYDLHVPSGVVPCNMDGEISRFELMPLHDVLAMVRDTDRFKFNVNLVIIDFAMRVGQLAPDNTPDYEQIALGLRNHPQPIV